MDDGLSGFTDIDRLVLEGNPFTSAWEGHTYDLLSGYDMASWWDEPLPPLLIRPFVIGDQLGA